MKLGNLAARVATALVLVPPIIVAILADRHEWVGGIVLVAAIIAMNEFFSMTLKDPLERGFALVLGTAACAGLYWWPPAAAMLTPAAVLLPGLFFLFHFVDLTTVVARWSATTLGILYAGVLFMFLALLKRDGGELGGYWVLLVLMTAWMSDTGAYFAGRFLGKTKLYPAISPGKTRAGAVGGVCGSFLAAVVCNLWFFPELGWMHGAIITIVGSGLGQCGDLVESMLKRATGVKDSGKLLPGHGGMLDRVDAVLFIAPWIYFYGALVWRPTP